jgi:hypothetical protein
MDNQTRSRIADHFTSAIGRHAVTHSAALVFASGRSVFMLGSATCVQVGAHFLLATAGHNFDDLPASLDIRIVPPRRGLEEAIPMVGRNATSFRGSSARDVAWLELAPDVASAHGLTAVPLDRLQPHHGGLEGHLYLVQGLPHALAKDQALEQLRKISLTSVSYLTESAPGGSHNRDIDLPLVYDRGVRTGTGTEVSIPPPNGFSGGGVWAGGTPEGESLWLPDQCSVVGIVRGYLPNAKRLVAVQIQHWLELVGTDLPDTTTLIQNHLHRPWVPSVR